MLLYWVVLVQVKHKRHINIRICWMWHLEVAVVSLGKILVIQILSVSIGLLIGEDCWNYFWTKVEDNWLPCILQFE